MHDINNNITGTILKVIAVTTAEITIGQLKTYISLTKDLEIHVYINLLICFLIRNQLLNFQNTFTKQPVYHQILNRIS